MRFILFIFAGFMLSSSLYAQTENDRLNIFIDCQMRCDFTYIRQEINFVNFMQDRYLSDIYILATRQRTGSGGEEIQLVITGNQQFENRIDTLIYSLSPDATEAIEREQFVINVKRGILPFITETYVVDYINYNIDIPQAVKENTPISDPWKFWVFNIGGNFNYEAESNFERIELNSRFSSSRVTEESKFSLYFSYDYEIGNFDLGEDEDFTSIIERYYSRIRHIISLNEHWSAGYQTTLGSSTFGNTDLESGFRPAIEYNIYPYGQAATKRFSFNYSIGPEYRDYSDTTIFNKISETILRQRLDIEFSQTQKWGELEVDAGFSQFLHNPSLYSAFLNPNLDWQVMKGLSIDFGGVISFVGDRINIPKEELTNEEILLQIRQLDTSFRYFTYIGINYRFGSKFNNFVNPRF